MQLQNFVGCKNITIFKEQIHQSMKRTIVAIYNFYIEGFRNMTWGRQLWWVILLKVILLFAVLRVFFFKPVLAGKSEEQKIEHISNELIRNKIEQEN